MVDTLTKHQRSECMKRVRGKNTKPEMFIRKLVFSMGYRYRLHRRDLPGCPDIVFSGRKKVIFVHGCFWHGHPNCKASKLPETRKEFWKAKIISNQERDRKNIKELENLGWKVLVFWQCELKDISKVAQTIKLFLTD